MIKLKQKIENILLIDDSESDNFFHKRKIERLGISKSITVCLDGQEALEFLNKKVQEQGILPQLIFVDINMPGMNGWEFLKEYAKLEDATKNEVVVNILSNSIDDNDKERAAQNELVNDYFSKPLGAEVLEYIVQNNFKYLIAD